MRLSERKSNCRGQSSVRKRDEENCSPRVAVQIKVIAVDAGPSLWSTSIRMIYDKGVRGKGCLRIACSMFSCSPLCGKFYSETLDVLYSLLTIANAGQEAASGCLYFSYFVFLFLRGKVTSNQAICFISPYVSGRVRVTRISSVSVSSWPLG